MKNCIGYLVGFTLLLCLLQCNQTSEVDMQNRGNLAKLAFTDQGCVGLEKSVAHLIQGEDALNAWKYEDGILHLDFIFPATCGSLFMEETKTTGSVLEIVLTDTSDAHAHCTCDFMESFSFSVQNTRQIQVILSVNFYASHEPTMLVDRLITF